MGSQYSANKGNSPKHINYAACFILHITSCHVSDFEQYTWKRLVQYIDKRQICNHPMVTQSMAGGRPWEVPV